MVLALSFLTASSLRPANALAKKHLLSEGIISVRSGDSVGVALRKRASMTLGADKLPGGRVPTLFAVGPYWRMIEADVDRIEATEPGLNPDSGPADGSRRAAGRARVHRVELTCAVVAPPSADMLDLLAAEPDTADSLQQRGWGAAFWRRPATATKTVILNGLLRHTGDLDVHGYLWHVTWHRSKGKDWSSVTLRLRKESATRLPATDVAAVIEWLWTAVNDVRSALEARHSCALEPRTTMEQWAGQLEAALAVESEKLTDALNAFAALHPGRKVSVTTTAGQRFWFDQSPGPGKWEVEGAVANAADLEPLLAEMSRAAEGQTSAEAHHEIMVTELRGISARLSAIESKIEVQA